MKKITPEAEKIMVERFGKELALDFESVGNVEIVTKPKRLIERLFDNLKAKTEK